MSEDSGRVNPKPPSVDRVSLLWRRVNDHKMVQWSVAYVALAYGMQHAVTLITEAFEWPHAVERVSMLLLALGLPLVTTLAWYHGARASRRISGPELTIISILLVMSSLLFYVFVRPSAELAAPAAQQAGVTAARSASASPKGAISLAVLPFVNLSDDRQQEFFSDGITDEIGTALAKIPDLRVVARQSAYRFKGGKEDARVIGQELSATHLLEGSVRKAGNRVRISVELVKADDGLRVWTENYDRDLTDVFVIQEDIARAITASLHMTLGLKPGENLVNQRLKDPALHDEYLRAKKLINDRSERIRLLNDVVARDPNYAPAWGLLARAYVEYLNGVPAVLRGAWDEAAPIIRETGQKATVAAETAYRLDPNDSDAVYGYSELEVLRGKPNSLARMKLVERALEIDPDNPEPIETRSNMLAALGFVKQAISVSDHLLAVDPFVPQYIGFRGRFLIADGQPAAAVEFLQQRGGTRAMAFAQAYAAMGQFAQAADALAQAGGTAADEKIRQMVNNAVRLLRGAPATAPENDRPELGAVGDWIYVYRGAPERTAQAYEMHPRAGVTLGFLYSLEFAPTYAAMRKTPAFKRYIRESGSLEYWRARGWPPQCRQTTGDDFECN